MRSMFVLLFAFALAALPAHAARPEVHDKAWQALKPTTFPKRINGAFPLSDQSNKSGWAKHEPMWDEFEGGKLDAEKWWPRNPQWKGRKPGYFSPGNVAVKDGKLHLTMRKQEPPEAERQGGYHTWTCAAVKSKGTALYGYYEVKARPMKSAGSSSFWFYNREDARWTEIDVFEIGGGAGKFERRMHMNLHVFHTPTEKEHWSVGGAYVHSAPLADGWHVYGLEWDAKEISFYFDGALVRRGPNTHWHQPLTLNFDSETMPKWFGLPEDADLPSTYSIEYVRAWKRKEAGK